jgi:hypothetical protein
MVHDMTIYWWMKCIEANLRVHERNNKIIYFLIKKP